MSADIFDTLCEAIKNRSILELHYTAGTRIVEPHTYGASSQGNQLLRAFQSEGASSSGKPTDWKLLRVDRISNLIVLADTFQGPRPGYALNDSVMKGGIYAQLPLNH